MDKIYGRKKIDVTNDNGKTLTYICMAKFPDNNKHKSYK